VATGPWRISGGGEVFFYRRGIAFSNWGGGSWSQVDATTVSLKLCKTHTLKFDSAERPTSFTYEPAAAGKGRASLPDGSAAYGSPWEHAESVAVAKVLGEGPWHFDDKAPIAFLWGGVVASPWGAGTYAPIAGSDDSFELSLNGHSHRMRMTGCYTFRAVRAKSMLSAETTIKGWVPMNRVSMEYTHWRDSWGCQL